MRQSLYPISVSVLALAAVSFTTVASAQTLENLENSQEIVVDFEDSATVVNDIAASARTDTEIGYKL